MNLRTLFRRKPDPSEAGRSLAKLGKWEQRLKVREQANRMRAELGQPPITDWSKGV